VTGRVRFATLFPGFAAILGSSRAGLIADARAGLSVAAVSIPTAIAYTGLMGVPAQAGLHAAILPLVAYAIFGQSRRLIVGPDTATCVLVGGSLTALGLVDAEVRLAFAAVLAVLAGLFCIGAGLLRLGAMADFLAWPILVGFLNGVALDLMLGQAPRMLGLPSPASEAFLRVVSLVRSLPQTHWPTAVLSVSALALVLGLRRVAPIVPGALVACIAAGAASVLLDLPAWGVAVLGAIPSALPGFALPDVQPAMLLARRYELVQHAAGIALISFASFMVPARAFAARRGETTDADREAIALGIANIVGGLAKGFAVSGTSSRTAVNEASGAQSPAAGLVAAAALAVAMALLAAPLAVLPRGVMAALMVQAALSMLDLASLRTLWRLDRAEAGLSLVATAGVLLVGPLNAVLVSVALAILRFVKLTARPVADELGRLPGTPGFHARRIHPDAVREPGMLFFRFNGPVVFFNAPSFQRAALAAADAVPDLEWFVLDLFPITQVDATGLETLRQVTRRLTARGVRVVGAGRRTEVRQWLSMVASADDSVLVFPTMNAARHAFRAERKERAAAITPPP
jgi:high affinity sulfate transporter 1